MKTAHANLLSTSLAQPAANDNGGYSNFVSAEKAKCQVMLDILEFMLRFDSVSRRDPDIKKPARLFADIAEARQKLQS